MMYISLNAPIFLPIYRTVCRKLTIKGLRDQVSKWFCGVGSVLGYTHTHMEFNIDIEGRLTGQLHC
jgi:hypothetical protein